VLARAAHRDVRDGHDGFQGAAAYQKVGVEAPRRGK
jgi:hypothetical protein